MSAHQRYVLAGDLEWLEYAIADYISKWGGHLPGVERHGLAGTPVAAANMAMTVIRKNILTTWEEHPCPEECLRPRTEGDT